MQEEILCEEQRHKKGLIYHFTSASFTLHPLLDLGGGIKSPVMAKQCNYTITSFMSFQCLSSGFGFYHCNICMELVY